MQQKIFIGIDLDMHLKKAVVKSLKEWRDLPVKWYDEDGFHIALLPIGWVEEDDVLRISEILAELCSDTDAFSVDFDKIITVAKDLHKTEVKDAQIVRLVGEESEELRVLYHNLAEALDLPISEKRSFRPHVDLGRIRVKKWQELADHPQIEVSFPAKMDVATVTLFENAQIEGKRQFIPIEVFELQ